jgi:hypothetical protein
MRPSFATIAREQSEAIAVEWDAFGPAMRPQDYLIGVALAQ